MCVFCKILSSELEGSFVFRDAHCAAFMNLSQENPGYVLVIPTRHVPSVLDLTDDELTRLWSTARRVAKALPLSGVRCEGINFFISDGTAAQQEVPHCHLHVMPRFKEDGIQIGLGREHKGASTRAELDLLAKQIAGAIEVART